MNRSEMLYFCPYEVDRCENAVLPSLWYFVRSCGASLFEERQGDASTSEPFVYKTKIAEDSIEQWVSSSKILRENFLSCLKNGSSANCSVYFTTQHRGKRFTVSLHKSIKPLLLGRQDIAICTGHNLWLE